MNTSQTIYPRAHAEKSIKVHPGSRFFRKSLFLSCLCIAFQHANADVTLAWDASPEPGVTGYIVYYGTSSGTYTQQLDAGNTTSASVPDPNPASGSTWYFVVTAYTSDGVESDPSNEIASELTPPAADTWGLVGLSGTAAPGAGGALFTSFPAAVRSDRDGDAAFLG